MCYIYFRYSDHIKATTEDFLEVLVKQTVQRHPQGFAICQEVYAPHIEERTRPSVQELLGLLRNLAASFVSTFYFLDAIDEAPTDVQLDLLEKLSPMKANLFITSRPMETLQARFPSFHQYPIRAQDRDLELHIDEQISRSVFLENILGPKGSPMRKKVEATVKEKCGGM